MQRHQAQDSIEPTKERSKTGESEAGAMEEAQEQAAEEREQARGYQ